MQGLGTDIIEIGRIERAIQAPRFLSRVFTSCEREYIAQCPTLSSERAAGMFCAKEAVSKALGTGFGRGLRLTDIEITHDAFGAPLCRVNTANAVQVLISISHCQTYATATAIVLGKPA